MSCCGEAVVDLCVDRNGVESTCDWVGTDVVVNISGTSVGAAAKRFVKEVNAEKELVTCPDEWSNQELGALKHNFKDFLPRTYPRMFVDVCWIFCDLDHSPIYL